MKNWILIFGLLGIFSLFGEEIFKVDLRNEADYNRYMRLGVWPDAKASMTYTAEGAQCTVEKTGENNTSIECFLCSQTQIVKGTRYTFRFRIRTNQDSTIMVSCYLNYPNWRHLSYHSSGNFDCKANTWHDFKMEFNADVGSGNIRVPSLRLGKVPAGTIVTLQSVSLEKDDNSEVPEYTPGNLPAIENFSNKICWDLSKAWKKETARRVRYSMNAYWKFIPSGLTLKNDYYLMVPGSWRGYNPSAFVRDSDGLQIMKILDKNTVDYEDVEMMRTFSAPEEWLQKSVVLKCDYIHADTEILLNGVSLGIFNDATDFMVSCDLGPALKAGENTLVLRMHGSQKLLSKTKCGPLDAIFLDVREKKNFGLPSITTFLSKGQASIEFLDADKTLEGELHLKIRDAATDEIVKEFTVPFAPVVSLDYIGPKLWNLEHPNLYFLDCELIGKDGKLLDAETVRFGFREFSISGKNYMLNGEPIRMISANSVVTKFEPVYFSSPETYRNRLLEMKRMCHTAARAQHDEQSSIYDVADEVGFLLIPEIFYLSYTQQEQIDDEEALRLTRRALAPARLCERYRNHPCISLFVMDIWFNLHLGSLNPEYFGIDYDDLDHPDFDKDGNVVPNHGHDPNLTGIRLARQKRLQKISDLYQEFFPGAIAVSSGSGQIGGVYANHVYHTWGAPMHEMRGFMRRYSLAPKIPVYMGEMNPLYPMAFYYPLTNPDDHRPMYYENAVRFLGNRAYRFNTITGFLHDVNFEQRGGVTANYSFPVNLYTELLSIFLKNTQSAWRLCGLNGLGPFSYVINGNYIMGGVWHYERKRPIPDNFTSPWHIPEYLSRGATELPFAHAGEDLDLRPSPAAAEFLAAWSPIAIDFFGSGKDNLETDHAFFGGDTVSKSVVIMNDMTRERQFELCISLKDRARKTVEIHRQSVTVPAFSNVTVPFEVKLPFCSARTEWKLVAELCPADEEKDGYARCAMGVEAFPAVSAPVLSKPLYVYDPEGLATAKLDDWKIPYTAVADMKDLPEENYLLLVGRNAINSNVFVPDFDQLTQKGVSILVLEQNREAEIELMKVRERYAFIHAPEHPVLQGLKNDDFALWQGSHSILPSHSPGSVGSNWTDWGSRNMVAGIVFRRPSHGNFKALLVSGFDFYQSPLLEYVGDTASWIGCQLDVSERLGSDPVATTVFARLLGYLGNQCAVRKAETTAFYGGEKGRALLDKLQVSYKEINDLSEKSLLGISTLIVADPDFLKLNAFRFEVNHFVHTGNRILYLQCGDNFSDEWLPFMLKCGKQTFRNAVAGNQESSGIWLDGFNSNDFAYEKSYELPVFTDFPIHWDCFNPAVLLRAPYGDGEFVFSSLVPEIFGKDYAAHKQCRFLCALLTAAGVKINIPGTIFSGENGASSKCLDLTQYDWAFALDPNDVGLDEKWQEGNDGSGKWIVGQTDDAKEVRLGSVVEYFLGKEVDGVMWYRLKLNVDEAMLESKKLYLSFGPCDDMDDVYINGTHIGGTDDKTEDYESQPRLYGFDSSLFKPGLNLIAIRLDDKGGDAGIRKLPCIITNRPIVGGRGWSAPYIDREQRDYYYDPNIVRGF